MEEKHETITSEVEEKKKRSLKRKKRKEAAKALKKLKKDREEKEKLENPESAENEVTIPEKVKKNEEDIELKCSVCQQVFFFTKGEQYYYKWKRLNFQPSRCEECREKRKQRNKKNDKRKPKVCKDWRNGNEGKGPGCNRSNCRFLHYEKGEERGVCFAWKRGKCPHSAFECKFKHEDDNEQ